MRNKTAFTLIELSIVILVIGILTASVMGGKSLIRLSALTKARSLTLSSPVVSMDDLAIWLETTSKNSFTAKQPNNGDAISTWKDINPQLEIPKNATAGGAPIYKEGAINGLPALNFNAASSQALNYDGSFLIGNNFSIFVVEQRSSSSMGFILGGSGVTGLALGYLSNTNYFIGTNSLGINSPVNSYTTPIPRILEFTFSPPSAGGVGGSLYVNGVFQQSSTSIAAVGSYDTPTIGTSSTSYYSGDIGEIIIFSRLLSDYERGQVEQYLSKKWSIKLP